MIFFGLQTQRCSKYYMFALLLRPDEHVSGHSSVLCDKKAGIDDALQIDRYGQYTRYT